MRGLAALGGAIVVGLSLGACSLPFSDRGGPRARDMTCPTTDVVNDKLGSTVDDVHGGPLSDDSMSCVYLLKALPVVNVYVKTDDDRENFDYGRTFLIGDATVTDLPGFYDSAFTLSHPDDPKSSVELQVLDGQMSISITALATVDQEKALATHMFDTM
jgi:hypothetical protein